MIILADKLAVCCSRNVPEGRYGMTIEECYNAIGSNYEEVLGRFAGNKMLVEKFARKFIDDPSYQMLADSMEKQDYEEAFRAAHTLKGVCANLGFTKLFKVSSEMTEELRGGNPKVEKLPGMFEAVSAEYRKTVDAVSKVNG